MLLIFDLDDTLIKTSSSLVPLKLSDALKVMVQAGFKLTTDFDEALKEFLEISKEAKSGRDTITLFCNKLGQAEFAELGIQEYYHNIDTSKVNIPAMDGANELLRTLNQQGHSLFLVSHGVKEQQFQKMGLANLDHSVFEQIHLTEKTNKEIYYQKIIDYSKTESTELKNIVVIGDSIERDLLPAKKLGITTVHLRKGRGKHIQYTPQTQPSFSIKSLKEVFDVIQALNNN